jgi:hypothetical protein
MLKLVMRMDCPRGLLLLLLSAAGWAHGQASNNMGCIRGGAWDVGCLVRASQFTVLADVVSNDLGDTNTSSTPTNYTAVLNVLCAWASFSAPPTTASGLVGRRLTLMNIGYPNPICSNARMGNTAVPGKRQLFFLYVSSNATDPVTRYTSTSVCAGEFTATPANKQVIANILATSPANRMANVGSNAECALPASTVDSTNTAAGGNGATAPDGNGAGRLLGSGGSGWWISVAVLPLLLQLVF